MCDLALYPMHRWYLQKSMQAWFLLWIVPFTWSRYWFGLQTFCVLDWTHWFWLQIVPFPWSGHTDFDYWLVWPVNRNAYSSWAIDPTSGLYKGPCLIWICISYKIFETHHRSLYCPFILMGKRWVWCHRRPYS
jgi:hypothetical protein